MEVWRIMRLVTLLVGSALVLAVAGNGRADDTSMCKRVNKMLSMGRTTEDIVTTSAGTITEDDIERCKSEKSDSGGATGGAAGGEQKKE
jgi:hypothetical protein